MEKLIKDNKEEIKNFLWNIHVNKKKKHKNIQKHFVCLEDFRNISYGFIDSLIEDTTPYLHTNRRFWLFMGKQTKRLKFIELSKLINARILSQKIQ